jgi:mitochondrial fission protein ELM1
MASSPLIWVLTDDRAGNAAQVLGVAEALNRPFVTKKIAYTPLAELPSIITGAGVFGLTPESRTLLTAPWPDIVISAGRRTGPVARWIKRRSEKPIILVHLMYPGRRGAAEFDLIVAPNHDGQLPNGGASNVMRITGAPHRVNPTRLNAAVEQWKATVGGIPRPFIALLVGGATRSQAFPAAHASELGRKVARMAGEVGGSVLLTTSRRTSAEAEHALEHAIPQPSSTFFWSNGGENPYMGFLALADAIVVTGDSVSMCSEACASPAPVYIYAPNEITTPKHQRLHRELYDLGLARPFDEKFEDWVHPPLNAANDIADQIEELISR